MAQPLWKMTWQFLSGLNIYILCDATIRLLGIFPSEMKAYLHEWKVGADCSMISSN